MPENELQMPRDHGGLIGAYSSRVIAQLEVTLKPVTKIPTLHDQALMQFDEGDRNFLHTVLQFAYRNLG
jgi:hypothetical protein